MAITSAGPPSADPPSAPGDPPSIDAVGGPVPSAWREGTLTRAAELESLFAWLSRSAPEAAPPLNRAVAKHLQAARPRRHLAWLQRSGPSIERAISNLDAAEAHLLQVAPADFLLGAPPRRPCANSCGSAASATPWW